VKYSARFAIRRSHALGFMGLWVHGQWPVTDVSIGDNTSRRADM
jgi:hypothetical protein